MTAVIPSQSIRRGHEAKGPKGEIGLASNQQLVLAFFESEDAADGAADALRGWAKTNRSVQLEAVGVLAKDEQGNVKTPRSAAPAAAFSDRSSRGASE
jgi:hypothetical protein